MPNKSAKTSSQEIMDFLKVHQIPKPNQTAEYLSSIWETEKKVNLFRAHGVENIKKLQYCAWNGFISKNIYYKHIYFPFNLWKITNLLVLTSFIETDELSTLNGFRRLKEYMANYILWGFSKETKHIIIHFYRLLFIF